MPVFIVNNRAQQSLNISEEKIQEKKEVTGAI